MSTGVTHIARTKDNCVGQNKSQLVCAVGVQCGCAQTHSLQVLQWEHSTLAMLYHHVDIYYLIKGHTHFNPDHVFGNIKTTLKGKNVFLPHELVGRFNQITSDPMRCCTTKSPYHTHTLSSGARSPVSEAFLSVG